MNATLEVLTVSGSSIDRGRAIGEHFRERIHAYIERRDDQIEKVAGMSASRVVDALLQECDYRATIEAFASDLAAEVRGVAESAIIDVHTAFSLTMLDELMMMLHYKGTFAEAWIGCSSFGVIADSEPILAQTMDMPLFTDGAQAIIRHVYAESDLEVCLLTDVGSLGRTGISNRSLACCCNALRQLRSSRVGLPVDYVLRRILECSNVNEAVQFLRLAEHASGQNYLFGDGSDIVSAECSARVVALGRPDANGRLAHTNHPLWSSDYSKAAVADGTERTPNSLARLAVLEHYLSNKTPLCDSEHAMGILRDETPESPISLARPQRVDAGTFTFGAVVFDLKKPHPMMHATIGPPAATAFATIRL